MTAQNELVKRLLQEAEYQGDCDTGDLLREAAAELDRRAPAASVVPEGCVVVNREALNIVRIRAEAGRKYAHHNHPNLEGDFSAIESEVNAMLAAAPVEGDRALKLPEKQ